MAAGAGCVKVEGMSRTATRLLSLLSLLQGPRTRSGAELAERLEVTVRTVRNDVERLRELGYEIDAIRGSAGGYRLAARDDAGLPPLLLDDDEAIAVAVGLRTGVSCIFGGMEETSLRALAKLEQVLPQRMRRRLRRLNHFTVPLPSNAPVPIVDAELLVALVNSCAERRRVRFHYAEDDLGVGIEVEPYRMVNSGHRWYLLGYDVGAGEWSIHDASGIRLRTPGGPSFEPRELPADDIDTYVAQRMSRAQLSSHRARAVVAAPAEDLRRALAPAEGVVHDLDEESSEVWVTGTSWQVVALTLLRLGSTFQVDEPALVEELASLEHLCAAATASRSG